MSKLIKCDVCGKNINMEEDSFRFEVHEIFKSNPYNDDLEDHDCVKDICNNCFNNIFSLNKELGKDKKEVIKKEKLKNNENIMDPPRIVMGMGM